MFEMLFIGLCFIRPDAILVAGQNDTAKNVLQASIVKPAYGYDIVNKENLKADTNTTRDIK